MKNKSQKKEIFKSYPLIKNKKGFLLTEETLKIIVAVIGLTILIYFLVAFFYSGADEKKQREAAAQVEKISLELSNLSLEGDDILALQPQRWWVFSFVNEKKKPNSCAGENCLCICDKVFFDVFDKQIKECANDGACLVIGNLKEFEEFQIKSYEQGTTNINIKEISGEIEIIEIK